MDSTPPELFHRYKGFGYVGILGDEESCEMKRKFLWIQDMWGDFCNICNWRVDRQIEHPGIEHIQ